MRIIPKKTKVSTEFFRGVSLADILVGFFGILIMFCVFISSLPWKLWIELALFFVFALLLARIDEEPNYLFLLQLLRHFSHERRYQKMDSSVATGKGGKKKPSVEKRAPKEKKRGKDAKKTDERKDRGNSTENDPDQGPGEADPQKEPPLSEETVEPEAEITADASDQLQEPSLMTAKERRAANKAEKRVAKAKKKAKIAEDKFLKSRKVPEEEKAPIRERRKKEAQERYYESKVAEQKRNRKDIQKMTKITEIYGGFINYSNDYFGAAIEIPAVEFRFFSPNRRTNAIDRALGSVIRNVGAKYAANLVKIERPMVLDQYIEGEYDKIDALKLSYERGVFSEEELKARIEIIYDRINELRALNLEEKVLVPHFYLVLFDSDKRQLENQITSAISSLTQGEMTPHRLDDKELAVFLRYVNSVDFDEREIENCDTFDFDRFALPESLEIKMRTTEVNNIINHNFRVLNYPLLVDDAWGASLFDIPGTKVVMKFSQMDREKSIRAIDRSISELNSQLDKTAVSSRIIELETHIETLSELLVMLQNNNENLMAMNMYITGYDIAATRDNKLLVPQPPPSILPRISGMKKDIKRTFSEQGFKLTDMIGQQFEAYVATQVNGYDPFAKRARGVPSSTVAGVFPWVYANMMDEGGLNLGSSEGVPTFLDFFRRDSDRVNSNMVIVGKSGGGKSYATKSILTNLAADDAKIFVLDPENEYTELAGNLHGKFINTANASHGRINPFHIITSLEDDEAADGQETNSFSAHLQFLEEFFRQILPEIDGDAMEYLNNLIIRVYSQRNIDQFTNLAVLRPEDYPIFDDLYDCILEEFQRTKSDYLKSNLRVLMNYIAKFSTGGRNANIWNGPSTLSTIENFIVFNFQTLLANRNNTVANAQMLLVLKYLDNEIIKNREYNVKYGASRKIIVVIDEAHVFIDAKYPLALDFMFQLAKRIRKYNGMQIVITQNIKDFVGSEELARKSTAIINACQYSFIFSLAPNDMHDLCTLYEKAGGINESEQEQIISAPRGQAFVVTSPTSRASVRIETPKPVEEMFSVPMYATHYFGGEEGAAVWEEALGESREARAEWEGAQIAAVLPDNNYIEDDLPDFRDAGIDLVELEEEELLLVDETPAVAESLPKHMKAQSASGILVEEDTSAYSDSTADGAFSPEALQRYGFEALVSEIRRTVRQEVENELGLRTTSAASGQEPASAAVAAFAAQPAESTISAQDDWFSQSATSAGATGSAAESAPTSEDWFTSASTLNKQTVEDDWSASAAKNTTENDWFASATKSNAEDDWFAPAVKSDTEKAGDTSAAKPDTEEDWFATSGRNDGLDSLFDGLFAARTATEKEEPQPTVEEFSFADLQTASAAEKRSEEASSEPEVVEEKPLVYEVTLEELMAMGD